MLFSPITQVATHQSKPYADRPLKCGRREVETSDTATVLFEQQGGASGLLAFNRSAWGRKGRIALQILGDKGLSL